MQIGRPEYILANPQLLRPVTPHFCPTHYPTPQSGRHMCMTLKHLTINNLHRLSNLLNVNMSKLIRT